MRWLWRFVEVLNSGLRVLWQTARMARRTRSWTRPPTNSNAQNDFILSLAEAIYVRFEILTHLVEKRMKRAPTLIEEDTMKRITHLAGPAVSIHTKDSKDIIRVVQRCMVCGEKLLEKKIHKDRNRGVSSWDVGDWLEQQDDGSYHGILPTDQSGSCSPPNTCSVMVEEDDSVVVLMPEDGEDEGNEN